MILSRETRGRQVQLGVASPPRMIRGWKVRLSCSFVKWKPYSHHPRQRGRNDCKTGLRQPVSTREVDAIRWCCQFINTIDRLHKWRPKKYSFVFVLIRPTSLFLMEHFFCILSVPTRLESLISIKRKESVLAAIYVIGLCDAFFSRGSSPELFTPLLTLSGPRRLWLLVTRWRSDLVIVNPLAFHSQRFRTACREIKTH